MPTENRTKTPAQMVSRSSLLLLRVWPLWFLRRAKSAPLVHPERVSITETIAQLSGTIEHLFVKVGNRVKSGQVFWGDWELGNIDSRSGDEVFNTVGEMNREKGIAFIMVTHDDPRPGGGSHLGDRRRLGTGSKQARAPHETPE